MPNGTLYAGRAVGSIFAGRALSQVSVGNGGPAGRTAAFPGSGLDWPAFPRSALCTPPIQCCCKGPWTIAPGEALPLLMDWSTWINSMQGYNLVEVASASLWDMTKHPPAVADPDIIKVIPAKPDPDPVDNGDIAHLIDLIPPNAMQAVIEVSRDAVIGAQYKLDLCLSACSGCDGRRVTMCDCVVITIQEC